MSEAFESARMKARKLAALAAAGVDGECENAIRLLEAHLAKHGLTMAALSDETRTDRHLNCIVDPKKLIKDTQLRGLAVQTLCYVLAKRPKEIKYGVFEVVTQGAKGKRCKLFRVQAELTELEHEDWVACYLHYAPAFVSTRTKLRKALKMALNGFVQQHGIFPPSDEEKESKPLTRAQIEALIAAMKQADGDKWERPAGRLEQGGFMLA